MNAQTNKPVLPQGSPENEAGQSVSACIACDAARQAGAKYCPQCARTLHKQLSSEPVVPVSGSGTTPMAPPSERPEEVQERPDPKAGPLIVKEIESPSTSVSTCRRGHILPSGASFCPSCGVRVGEALPAYRLTRIKPGANELLAELVGDTVVIGKDDRCDVVLPDDDFVSRRHARLSRSDGTFLLEDLGSSNGTLLRVRRSIMLEVGDEIVIGTTALRLDQID